MNKKYIVGSILPLLLIAIWQLVSYFEVLPVQMLPSPIDIVEAFVNLVKSGTLQENLYTSLIRAAVGFFIGSASGILLGLIVGNSRFMEFLVDPSVQLFRMIPHLAILPLLILWFGFGEPSKIIIVASGAFFPVYINTFLGIRSVDYKLIEVSKVLEFSRSKQITKVVLPAAMPNILLGIRMSMGTAWLSLIVAELMGATTGVGYMISNAREFSQTDVVFVGIIIFACVGKITDSFVHILEKRLLRWRDSYQGVNAK
ncbi:ABC transporter permease [Paenibacillus zeisoli]|uniref:ABC transporter permease n=1 Tax=Paenibacillus zeisoli TaxID=2496267 RepID=A0A433XNY8_9BACL|nr:ABC transporter permease [Paenibacillus zeisoli]RUT35776.1 ABC transporter permease [Paenibacillus zeisoli]